MKDMPFRLLCTENEISFEALSVQFKVIDVEEAVLVRLVGALGVVAAVEDASLE